jgi:ATP-dependent RNA helicase DDX51/DBP6
MIVCETSKKPLMLFHLVHTHHVQNALVFTKSAESTTRLMRLFEFFQDALESGSNGKGHQPIVIRAYSSDLAAGERKGVLEKFRAQEIQMCFLSFLLGVTG